MTTPTTTTMSTMTATSAPRMPPGIILNAVSEPLPVYRVTAKNTSTGENKIHDDVTARRYGFPGALVPGVTVYAYMTQPLAAVFGAAWLVRGTANVRFKKPGPGGGEGTGTGVSPARGRR